MSPNWGLSDGSPAFRGYRNVAQAESNDESVTRSVHVPSVCPAALSQIAAPQSASLLHGAPFPPFIWHPDPNGPPLHVSPVAHGRSIASHASPTTAVVLHVSDFASQ